jgi:hypothetical protein
MSYVCPNSSCRRVFAKTLKTVNIGVSKEAYDACPFCLTEIPKGSVPTHLVPEKQETAHETDATMQSELPNTPLDCKKEFGYLGRRAPKEPIPDDCLTCNVIVQCMRKTKP